MLIHPRSWCDNIFLGCAGAEEARAWLPQLQNGCKTVAMRHGRKVARLGRPADQRRALVRNLTTEVLRHGKITTTVVRRRPSSCAGIARGFAGFSSNIMCDMLSARRLFLQPKFQAFQEALHPGAQAVVFNLS